MKWSSLAFSDVVQRLRARFLSALLIEEADDHVASCKGTTLGTGWAKNEPRLDRCPVAIGRLLIPAARSLKKLWRADEARVGV